MKECDIFTGEGVGQNILWPLLHVFRGQDPHPQVPVWSVPERFWGGVPRRGAISSVRTFTFTFTPEDQRRCLILSHQTSVPFPSLSVNTYRFTTWVCYGI